MLCRERSLQFLLRRRTPHLLRPERSLSLLLRQQTPQPQCRWHPPTQSHWERPRRPLSNLRAVSNSHLRRRLLALQEKLCR